MKIMNFVVLMLFLLVEPSVSFAASGGVTPSTGYVSETAFEFYVNLTGDLPSYADIRVSVNGGHAFILNGGPQYWSKTSTFSPAGTYNYELQVFNDGNFYQTIYHGNFTVLEQPEPDLIIYDLNLNKTTFSIGETLSIDAVVKNQGSGESDSTVLKYYLSTDSSISTSDYQVGTDGVSSLTPGSKSYESLSKSVDNPGTAYVGVCVDRVNNESNTSNNCSSGIRIEIVAPSIKSVNASPYTITAGATITFSAALSTSLPSGYSITVDYGAGQKSMSGSSTSYAHTTPAINTPGTNRPFTVYLKNSSGSTIDTKGGAFTVESQPDPKPPTVSISSASSSVTQGTIYSIRLDCRDPDGNLKNVFVNWGDGSTNGVVELGGSQDYADLTHTYSTPGSYTWRAEVHDHNELTASVTKTVIVTSDIPTISQIYTDPDEITAGETLRVYAKLSSSLPSGHNVKREFYDGAWKFNATMSAASSTLYFTEDSISLAGTRYCRAAIFDGETQVSNWVQDSFIVHEVENNHAPVISLVSTPDRAQLNQTVSIRVQATDVDNNLGTVQVNWGDGSGTSLFSHYSGDYFDATHVYQESGTYTWTATAYDNGSPNLYSETLSRPMIIEEAQANLPEATHFTPTSAIVGQYQYYTIYGSNLPADLLVNIEGSSNHCSNVSGSGNSVVVNCRADAVGRKHLYVTTETGGEAITGSEGFYVDVRSEAASGPLTPPLDGKQVSGAVFFDTSIPEAEISTYYYDRVDLLKNGAVVAYCPLTVMASGAGILNQSYLGLYFWYMSNGTPLTEWRQLVNSGENAEMQLKAHATDGSTENGNPFSVTGHSDLSVGISCKDSSGQSVTFPYTGELDATFSAQVSGSYSYRWLHDNGAVFSTQTTGTTTLGSGVRTGLCLITLEVDDNAGHLHYEQNMAYIDEPWESGSGGRRVNHVNVRNRNLYLSDNDLSVAAKGVSFALRRSYNSAKADANLTGWRFNLDQRLRIPTEQGGRELYLYRADGRQERYFRNNNGEWQAGRSGMFDTLMENSDGTYTLYSKGSIYYRFANPETGGALTAICDRDGNCLTITQVDSSHKQVTDGSGKHYTLEYNTQGRLVRATDFDNRSVQYTYDASGNLTIVQDVNGGLTTYQYNSDNLLTGIIDPRGNASTGYRSLTVTYDSSDQVATVSDADNHTTKFRSGLGSNGLRQTGVTRPTTYAANGTAVNNNSVYLMDDSGRIIEEVNAENYGDYRTQKSYKQITDIERIAEKGLLTELNNPRGYATGFSWSSDGRGNRTAVENALNETSRYAYQTEKDFGPNTSERTNINVVDSVTTPLSHTTRFEHTDSGKVAQVNRPSGATTNLSYCPDGLVEQVSDPRDNTTNFIYNSDGQVWKVLDDDGLPVTYTYDELGRTETVTDRRGGGDPLYL